MRGRYYGSLALLTFLALALSLRYHIRDLYEVARTYSTFHKYLERHPEVLLRVPNDPRLQHEVDDVVLPELVPKIIHQIFLTDGRPNASLAKYEPAIESCKQMHSGWKHELWTDETGRDFMAEHYPAILPHYVGYKQNIQRANILRYALLHHFGGVYVDLDVTCLASLDEPLTTNGTGTPLTRLPWVTPGAYPAGVNNAFILSRPGHPFLTELLRRVPSRDLPWPMPYVENMLSTGCMYFSNVWTAYAAMIEKGGNQIRKEDRVYILADENGEMESHMLRGKVTTPLFEHGGASSWHGWDAAAIVMVGKHYGYFGTALVALVAVLSLSVWKVASRRKTQPKRPSSWRTAIRRLSGERRSIEKVQLLGDEEQALQRED